MRLTVTAAVIEWRGPAPFFFLPIAGEGAERIREAAKLVSYGWGVVPVSVELADRSWTTSLMPRQGNYLLPLKDELRRSLAINVGDELSVVINISA